MEKKEFHVAYIITKLELGGAQKVCLSLFNGLQDKGISSFLISGSSGPLVQHLSHTQHTFLLPTLTRELSLKAVHTEIKNFFLLVSTIKKLKKEVPNLIVHTHSTKAGIIGRWAAFFAGITTIIHTIHGYAFHERQSRFAWMLIYLVELFTSCITTHYVCVSSKDVKTGLSYFPHFKQKYSVIRASVPHEKFLPHHPLSSLRITNNTYIYGTIACFKPQKNLFDLLKAFDQAYSQNALLRLEIIGDGILRPQIESWIRAHYLDDIITLHGWQHDVAAIMQTWHAFALSSLWEGLPCAIIEARLMKLPVLAYDTGGIYEVIYHGENGFLYKQGDWMGLAHGMVTLSLDASLHRKLSHYQDDLQEYSNDSMIKKHIDLYTSL